MTNASSPFHRLDALALGAGLLRAVRFQEPTQPWQQSLRELSLEDLQGATQTREAKLAFWINVYNAYTQIILAKYPQDYGKARFYTQPLASIAGHPLSLDLIEHGILRRSQFKYGLGYITWPWPNRLEKSLRVAKVDARIHFALNCGANSCPPIAFYEPEKLEAQLNLAAQSYLTQTVRYDSSRNYLYLSPLMLWFRGDFGGRKGILDFLQALGLIEPGLRPRFRYLHYDWQPKPHYYSE
ncbi:MAG: DUF547 domain-containing protein [Microscillaceae bacterium]|nr:DUF547 domain-containing protein [Microscillaceae bacterium]